MMRLIRFLPLAVILILIVSCAGDDVATAAPFWVNDETRTDEDSFLFTAVGRGADKEAAMDDLAANLSGKILRHMGYSDEDFSDFPEERAYLNSLFAALLEGDTSPMPEGRTEKLSWYKEDEQLAAAAQFRYEKERYERDKELLRLYLSGSGDFYRLIERADELSASGYPFSAFLYDMEAARSGRDTGGLLAGYLTGRAFTLASGHLEQLEIPLLVGAEEIYLGARRSWPYAVTIPLSPEEEHRIPWHVEMTIPGKSGERDVLDISLPSDGDGKAVLSYPFPSGEGEGRIIFRLYPGDFDGLFEGLSTLEQEEGQTLITSMNRLSLDSVIPVIRDRSVLKTAIIIEDRDVAGRLLDSHTTEDSVYASLLEESYNVVIEDFDLETLRGMSELEMVREFNSHYGNNYDIILFCEAGIRNFTQKGELYQMNAGAVLYEADLWEHRINVIEDITSSVSGSEPTRLVTSAFYQLGKDIAAVCLKLNSN